MIESTPAYKTSDGNPWKIEQMNQQTKVTK
jgi:hypothetical protein